MPIGLLCVWLIINPVFFARPRSTKSWVSKSVFGERVWSEFHRSQLPAEFRSMAPGFAQAYQVVGLGVLVYGLAVLNPVATVCGVLITQGGKFWYLDRMVLLYEAVKDDDVSVRPWVY